MQYLTLFSVDTDSHRIFAFVPESPRRSLGCLCADDRMWRSPRARCHWCLAIDPKHSRLRLRDRIKFRVVPL